MKSKGLEQMRMRPILKSLFGTGLRMSVMGKSTRSYTLQVPKLRRKTGTTSLRQPASCVGTLFYIWARIIRWNKPSLPDGDFDMGSGPQGEEGGGSGIACTSKLTALAWESNISTVHYQIRQRVTYEVWLRSSRNDFIASISVCFYSLQKGVTFEVLPLSTYALSPMMLPLLETFLELFLWNSFQCRRHIFWMPSVFWNLRPFKANFILGNGLKSFGVKSGE